jgi:hypothetical protein
VPEITDVYWDQVAKDVVIKFTGRSGDSYDLEAADADAYDDSLAWSTLTTVTAASEVTVTDDLVTNPLAKKFRFYRIKHATQTYYSAQTAAVFQMTLSSAPALKFISCPVQLDADHDRVDEVFGVGAARQVPRNNFQVSDLDEPTGALSRVRWDAAGNANLIAGAWFNIERGVGYEVAMGFGAPANYSVRFAGYVATRPLVLDLTKVGTQSLRWLGYSMCRNTRLSRLNLQTATTPWNALNRVRLLPPGASAWTNYKYNTVGGYWYKESVPGVPDDPLLTAGMGVVFLRYGPPDATDRSVLPRWYFHPPNAW